MMTNTQMWPACHKHQLTVFYPLRFGRGCFVPPSRDDVQRHIVGPLLAARMPDIAQNLGLDESVLEGMKKGERQAPVWGEKENTPLSPDFHPHLQTMFGNNRGETRPGHDCHDWAFRAHPVLKAEHPNNIFDLFGGGLEVKLPDSAWRRLHPHAGEPNSSPWQAILIEELALHLFGTGIGVVAIRISVEPGQGSTLSTQTLLETAGVLCRLRNPPRLRWRGRAAKGENRHDTTTLQATVEAFLQPALSRNGTFKLEPGPASRLFSYIAVSTAETLPAPQRRELAFRLARRYSDAYLPAQPIIESSLYQPFDNITHAISLEGGAVLLEHGERRSEFLENYFSNPVATAYRPLVLLAYQEYLALLAMTQGITLPVDFGEPSQAHHDALLRYKDWLLNFRLNFRFSHASTVSMHNDFYEKWRSAFSLNTLLQDATNDVAEVEHYLDYKLSERQNRRWSVFNHVQTGIGILIGTAIALTGFYGMNFNATRNMEFLDPFPVKAGVVIMAMGVVIAMIYALITILLRRK